MSQLELTINGEVRRVDVDPEMPLLWVLRDVLGMTGTKFGCGQGLCRTCTVHLGGRPVQSCQVPASAAAGAAVTTIEGLAEGETLHPLQQAWIDEQVPQCGYCQSGQLMTACALLNRAPRPSDQQIEDAMTPVICRCGTYPRVQKAIRRAAGMEDDS